MVSTIKLNNRGMDKLNKDIKKALDKELRKQQRRRKDN